MVCGRMTDRQSVSDRGGFTVVELLVSTAVIGVLMSLLVPAVQQAREAARRTNCQNNLRQMSLALHNFHDVHGVFPASGWTSRGPGNSSGAAIGWRALLLPYLEQASLANSYSCDLNWWAPVNLAAGANRLTVYQCPAVPEQPVIRSAVAKPPRPVMTFARPLAGSDYEALMGVRALIAPVLYTSSELTRGVMFRNSRVRFADITDGTSQTIVIAECAARPSVYRGRMHRPDLANDQGFGWIDSEGGFSLDGSNQDGSLQGLGALITPRAVNATNENEPYSFHTGGAFFVFADGHVQFLSESIDLVLMASLVTRAAGEVVSGSP